jgi:hypothetical protein
VQPIEASFATSEGSTRLKGGPRFFLPNIARQGLRLG